MPTFHVTDPSGAVYAVSAPDGATQADAIAYVQQNHAKLTELPAPGKSAAPPQKNTGYLQSIGDALGGAFSQLGQDFAPKPNGELQKPLGQQAYDMTLGGLSDALKQGSDLMNLVNAPAKAAIMPPVKAASDALYNAGIKPSVGTGGPGNFRFQQLNRDQAANQLADTVLTAASLGVPLKSKLSASIAAQAAGGAPANTAEAASALRQGMNSLRPPVDLTPRAPGYTPQPIQNRAPVGVPRSVSPPRVGPADLAATLRNSAPPMIGDAPAMPTAAATRLPWMPTDEEIDAAGIPTPPAPPQMPPRAAAPANPQPPLQTSPQGSPAVPPAARTGPPKIGAPVSATPTVPTIAAPSAPALPMTKERMAAWKLFERDAEGAGGAEAALQGALPWQTAGEAAGTPVRDTLQALASVGELPTGRAVSDLVAQRLANIPGAASRAAEDVFGVSPTDAGNMAREYDAAKQALATPEYENLRDNTGIVDSPRLRAIDELPGMDKFLAHAQDIVAREERPTFHHIEELNLPSDLPSGGRLSSPMGRRPRVTGEDAYGRSLDQLSPDAEGVTPVRTLYRSPTIEVRDIQKRLMDDAIEGALKNDRPEEARSLTILRNKFVDELDKLVPDYARVRNSGSYAPAARSSYAQAKRLFSGHVTNDEFAQAVKDMTPDQRKAVVLGHLSDFATQLGKREIGGMEGNLNLAPFISKNYEERLGALTSPKAAQSFVGRLRDIEESRKSALELLPTVGSKSARMIKANEALSKDMQGGLPTGEQVGEVASDVRKAVGKAAANAVIGKYNKAAAARTLPVMAERGRIMSLPAAEALAEYKAYKAARSGAPKIARTGRAGPPKLP